MSRLTATVHNGSRFWAKSYAKVFETGARFSFFLTRAWFENFTEHLVSDASQLRTYGVVRDDGTPVAALPMIQVRRHSILAPAALHSLSNYYSCVFAPVIEEDQNVQEVADVLAAALWRDRREWDVLDLKPIACDSTVYPALVKAFRSNGVVVQTYGCFGNWYLDVAGRSYDEYLASLPSVLRKNIPYNVRRLEKRGGSEIVIHSDESGLERALEAYERVYGASWKVREATPEFIRGVARMAARNGWLRLGLLYLDGRAAAAQLWIVYRDTASIYKIAYDEHFAKLSIGTVLTAKLMQHVIDVDKVKTVDYLSGEDEYKKLWMSHRREFGGILAFNPWSVWGLGQMARHMGADAGKRTVQRFAGKKVLDRLAQLKRDCRSKA